jgi:hypothetical protein
METKEELVNSIKQWISIDNDIASLQKQLKEKRLMKKQFSENLVDTMKKNEIDCFDIKGGSLHYKRTVTKKPMTGKLMLPLLESYFKDTQINHEEVTKYLLDNRQESVKEHVRRKIDK